MIYRIPIEAKSFFFNILNDNEVGHTATVSSILKQGGALREDVAQIYKFPEGIKTSSKQGLIDCILSKSRAEAKINKICCFNKITINGKSVKTDSSFCVYVREETSKDNVHFGRQKLHYPPTLAYSDSDVEINNRNVVKAISEALSDYAFLVEAFEFDDENGSLNFDAVIVGPKDIPYSKVFINQKGVGSKFTSVFGEETDNYDFEIVALRQKMGYDNVGPNNYYEVMRDLKAKSIDAVLKRMKKENVRVLSKEYPYAIYDLEYRVDGVKNYVIVRYTATKQKRFEMSMMKSIFLKRFENETQLFLVTDVLDQEIVFLYTNQDLMKMGKQVSSIVYDASEV